MKKFKSFTIDLFGESRTIKDGISPGQSDIFWTTDTEAFLKFSVASPSFTFESATIQLYNQR